MEASTVGQRATLGLFLIVAAAFAGLTTALAGNLFGERAAYYVAVFGTLGAGTLLAATRKEPLRFVFLGLILAFPLANAEVPPGRLQITVFDAAMLLLTLALLMRNAFSPARDRVRLMPTRSLLIAWLLCIPCVVLATFPLNSAVNLVFVFALYGFFLLALAELGRKQGLESLVKVLCIVAITMAAGVLVDFVFHVNLSTRPGNLNQLTYAEGREVYRAAGFFQDPQRSGAFLGTLVTFLLVLAVRGRFAERGLRTLAWVAIMAGLAALLMTISRSAILSCLLVSAVALFLFNGWSWHLKTAVVVAGAIAATLILQTPLEAWLNFLPDIMKSRLRQLPEEVDNRLMIWFDTWDMFSKHPFTGIGFGNFRLYLLESRPGVTNYYGIGELAGIDYVPNQPESGYFKILYEGGLLGSLAALILTGDAVRRAVGVAVAATRDARSDCIAALAALVVFGVSFATSFTTDDGRVAGLLAFLLAVIWNRSLARARA